jgi:hypothetical protein
MLVFEDLIFVSSHQRTRLPLPGSCRKLTVDLAVGQFDAVAASSRRQMAV